MLSIRVSKGGSPFGLVFGNLGYPKAQVGKLQTAGSGVTKCICDISFILRGEVASMINRLVLGFYICTLQLLSARNGCDCVHVPLQTRVRCTTCFGARMCFCEHVCQTRLCCDSFCVLCYRSAAPQFFRVKHIWFFSKKENGKTGD
jgi:hypothetical protein